MRLVLRDAVLRIVYAVALLVARTAAFGAARAALAVRTQ